MSDVSRETSRLESHYAALPALARYAQILAGPGVERGLIGPREVPRLWTRHIANCAVVAEQDREHLPTGSRVADVGSGAGLPGLVWALVRADLHVTLVEPLLRRATFLTEVVSELDLCDRVEVLRSRAEDVPPRTFDVVTARAVARLPQLLEWTMPLTEPGGWVLALKGSTAAEEVDDAADALLRTGGGAAQIAQYGEGLVDPPTTVVLVPKVRATQSRRR